MTRRCTLALVAIAAVSLAACTGVPTSSDPRTIEPVDVGGTTDATQPAPTPGADARDIVLGFLGANALDPRDHGTARQYLAPAARRSWSDSSATIISGQTVNRPDNTGKVIVSARVVGQLSPTGVYTPLPQGTGDGGPVEQFPFRTAKVRGENRITEPPSGLLLTTEDFAQYYQQHALYFFDQARRYLVPDVRWTALQGVSLDTWLVTQLASGPRTDLSSAVSNDTLPAQVNPRRISAVDGSPVKIEVPGASQLDTMGKRRLAAQISSTLTEPTSAEPVVMTDGGTAVPIPGFPGGRFDAVSTYPQFAPVEPAGDVFYLNGGNAVRDGSPLDGKLRVSRYLLTSLAVTDAPDSGLLLAGVTPFNSNSLVIGTETGGYRLTSVRGATSRPAWVPSGASGSAREFWVGVGSRLERIAVDGNRGTASVVSVNAGAVGGTITSVRLSPEGSRVALVVSSQNGSQLLYVGSVVRNGGQVRVDSLPPISPQGVTVKDAAWIGTQKLFAIGTVAGDARIFETNVDGSNWSARTTGSVLPQAPDSVTAAVGRLAWVSANGTVWQQSGRSWTSPGPSNATLGNKPVYLE